MPSDDPGVKRKRGRPSKKAALAAKKLKLSASTDASTGPIEAVENPGQPAEADGDLSSRYDTPLGSTPESPTPLRKTLRKTPAVGKFSTSASTSTRSSTRAGNVSNNAKGPRYSEDDNDTDDDTVDESKENREKSPQPIQAPKKRGRGRPRKSQTPLPSGKAAAGKAVAGKSKDGRRRTSARQSVLLANRQQEEDKLRATRASAKTTTRARKVRCIQLSLGLYIAHASNRLLQPMEEALPGSRRPLRKARMATVRSAKKSTMLSASSIP